MRLIVARLDAVYSGRIDATLDDGTYLVQVKANGGVSLHSDAEGAVRPLMWLDAPNMLSVVDDAGDALADPTCVDVAAGHVWHLANRRGEELTVRVHEVVADHAHALTTTKALVVDGVEKELQELVSRDVTVVEDGLVLVEREHETGIGPVDLLCRDTDDVPVVVELKRQVASLAPVEQISRYLEVLRDGRPDVRGVLGAQSVAPQARALCGKRGIGWVELDLDRLRGQAAPQTALF